MSNNSVLRQLHASIPPKIDQQLQALLLVWHTKTHKPHSKSALVRRVLEAGIPIVEQELQQ